MKALQYSTSKTLVIIIIAFGILSASCTKLISTKKIEGERNLVLNAIVQDTSQMVVSLSKSILFSDIVEEATIMDKEGSVFVSINGVATESYRIVDEQNNVQLFTTSYIPKAGDQIEVKATYPDLKSIYSSTTMPQKAVVDAPQIESLIQGPIEDQSWDNTQGQYLYYNKYINQINISTIITDIANQENYYGLRVKWRTYRYNDKKERVEVTVPVKLRSKDVLFNEIFNQIEFLENNKENYMVFTDNLFMNSTHALTFYLEVASFYEDKDGNPLTPETSVNESADEIDVEISIQHLSPELYKYWKSINIYNSSKDNPFAEPVRIFTNISGGLGILGSYTTQNRMVTIKIKKEK